MRSRSKVIGSADISAPTRADFMRALQGFSCELLFKELAPLFELPGAVESSETGE
jgi:hypothetical protein